MVYLKTWHRTNTNKMFCVDALVVVGAVSDVKSGREFEAAGRVLGGVGA